MNLFPVWPENGVVGGDCKIGGFSCCSVVHTKHWIANPGIGIPALSLSLRCGFYTSFSEEYGAASSQLLVQVLGW
jgi:hypothetical protein